jgi:hypothetical protein
MKKTEQLDDHQKFRELAALAQRGMLSEEERFTLERHLRVCAPCQQAFEEYLLISTVGMNFLAAANGYIDDGDDWDEQPGRERLLARVRQREEPSASANGNGRLWSISVFQRNVPARWAAVGLAAGVLLSLALGGYRLGVRRSAGQLSSTTVPVQPLQRVPGEDEKSQELAASQRAQISHLQALVARGQQEVARLRDALRAADARSAGLLAANKNHDEQFQEVSEERDKLASQLRDAEQSYELVQAELTTLRAERDGLLLRTSSLESKVDELRASGRDQERRLKDDEQFLASDRDIRELMGARKLYIADVFDVDSGSRTRKAFGRVFYTESKSLIFYAFDLDRQPGVKNASAFQVWGQRDTESPENRAMNLGILYMDSESNRRWVLRLDDPRQLAEIDAVFVTVEPHGGSQKPTGKPFLYALLRRQANHP